MKRKIKPIHRTHSRSIIKLLYIFLCGVVILCGVQWILYTSFLKWNIIQDPLAGQTLNNKGKLFTIGILKDSTQGTLLHTTLNSLSTHHQTSYQIIVVDYSPDAENFDPAVCIINEHLIV